VQWQTTQSGPGRCITTGSGAKTGWESALPNHPTASLAHGQITNHDEITVMLVEPTDGTPALVRVQWPTPAKC